MATDIEQVAQRFDLTLVVRFGSTATGREHPESDLDVAVWTRRPYDSRDQEFVGEVEDALDEALEPDREVDLCVLNDADPVLLFQVASSGVPLYQRTPVTFIEFCSWASRVYHDTEKFRRANRAWLEERLG